MARSSIEKRESLHFYKYLCQKIGSEKVVKTRRLICVISDIGQGEKMMTSGSKGEGLDLNGSDFDAMIIDPNFKVYQSESEVQDDCFAIPLIMNTEEAQPCFTQLWCLNHNIQTIPNVLEKHHRGYVLSGELFKLCYKNFSDVKIPALYSGKIHGPCISDKNDTLDIAWCLKCDKWIYQAEPWISRPRTTWPPHEIISKVISSGVLMVPIGCKGSINEHLEWRISFSVAEKFLIFSFSHTQLLCYAMLKILLKEIIEKHEDLKGLLCSYFLKTLMFWILEETDQYQWRPDNIIPCFMACLQRLLYCVKYSILSHYFISDNNLFYLRFNTNNEGLLTTILTNLYKQGINCFLSSETLHDFQSQSYETTESLINRSLQQIMPTFCAIRTNGRTDRVLRLLYNFLHVSMTALSRVLFLFQISEACTLVPEITQYSFSLGNKHNYSRYKHDLSHLVIGSHSDAVSGLLKLASFFYVHKNYEASLNMIRYTLQKCTSEKIYTTFFRNKNTFNPIQKHVLNLMKHEKLHTIMKSLIIHPCGFEVDSSIIPQELQQDVARTHNVFHTLPFAHFLSLLCYYHLNDISSCRQSLQRLKYVQWILSDCGTIIFEPESLNTIIFCGIGYQLIGETYIARHTFRVAAKLDKLNSTSAASRLFSLTS
ncbi:Hypothetical predicted protein [Mytilus galloprovincialis]|uniref:Mab-21-like HhH/H2TH-like domain-containing protein n=1 Tax=Mytilus galloprovincialis TaxID=29158 RepID=A0A8B6C128_MYTGA|nr:Hypothetical predicted protein [Mytilus galloprovincialis]